MLLSQLVITADELIAEIRKRMPKNKSSDPLGVAELKAVRETYNQYVPED